MNLLLGGQFGKIDVIDDNIYGRVSHIALQGKFL